MGGTVSEDYGGLDDEDEEMLPTIAARTRGALLDVSIMLATCFAGQARRMPPERLSPMHENWHPALSSRGPSALHNCTTSVTAVMSA